MADTWCQMLPREWREILFFLINGELNMPFFCIYNCMSGRNSTYLLKNTKWVQIKCFT